MEPNDLLIATGGIPFVDLDFQASILLTAVACARRDINAQAYQSLEDYLLPKNAYALYQAKGAPDLPAHSNLTEDEYKQAHQAIIEITALIPEWESLFSIPIAYRKLLTDQISFTNPHMPQYLFLAESAFKDLLTLQETLVHTASKMWCGFINELFDFQLMGCPKNLTVPAATNNTDVRGVLLGSIFAASALNLYERLNKQQSESHYFERIQCLQFHLDKSLELIEGHTFLSPMGDLLTKRLRTFSNGIYIVHIA